MNKPTTDPIRARLKRVLQLHTMAGGPWVAEVTPESDRRDIPITGPSGRCIARSPDDGVRAGFEIHDAQLIAEYRAAAPQLALALEAVLGVCEGWEARGEHDKRYSRQIPEEFAEALYEDGAEMIEKARIIRNAITKALGGST